MNSSDLCKWLRDNSSGIYRPARDAADLIEQLTSRAEAAEADARRYLWIRGNVQKGGETLDAHQFDSIIDAELAKEAKP